MPFVGDNNHSAAELQGAKQRPVVRDGLASTVASGEAKYLGRLHLSAMAKFSAGVKLV